VQPGFDRRADGEDGGTDGEDDSASTVPAGRDVGEVTNAALAV